MALTKQFSGNLVDHTGAAITNISVKGYHKETNTWSTPYDTLLESQYNLNLGDAQWLTQTGVVHGGDTILLVFETQETDPLLRQFALYETTLVDGTDVYIQDIQLQLCQAPNVVGLWDLSSTVDGNTTFVDANGITNHIGRINDTITASTNFNDDYTWTYAGVTLRHVETLYGQVIFSDRLSVDSIKFDWTASGIYSIPNTHSYTAISPATPGYYDVTVEAINQKGQVVTDTLHIQIRYNTPVPNLTWTPNTPSVQDTLTITGATTDVDSTITGIAYKFDGIAVVSNTNLTYQWIQPLGTTYQTSHTVNADVTWSDGFNIFTIVHQETITMVNLAPTFTLDTTVIGAPADNDVMFTPLNINDPDGDNTLVEVKWKIEFKTPFDNLYKVVSDTGYPTTIDQTAKEYIFTIAGDYRVTCTIKDSYGLETSASSVVNFNSSTTCTGSGSIRLNNNNWQLIAVPVDAKTVGDYFIPKVDALIKAHDATKSAADVIEVCSAYPGHINKFLSYIPGFTLSTSEQNFSLIIADGTNIKEVTGFWVKVKNYYAITSNQDLFVTWDQRD